MGIGQLQAESNFLCLKISTRVIRMHPVFEASQTLKNIADR